MQMSNGDSSSEMKDTSQQSTSDAKPADSDVAIDSNAGDPMAISTPLVSSPPHVSEPPTAVSAQG